MLDGRIYRTAFVPLLFVLVVVGFSLSGRPVPLSTTLAPDAFNGGRAFSQLQALASAFPQRRPGSAGDGGLADYVARAIREAGGSAGGGFQVSERAIQAQTIDGERTLRTVIAQRPGSTGESPILILAHRDAVHAGSVAELSATAALIELARVFAHSETRRAIVLASTSGGTGGDAGAEDLAAHPPGRLDAAIALGDLAGRAAHEPFVVPFSSDSGWAPDRLVGTLAGAISQEVGVDPGEAGLGAQLAHLAVPVTLGEQAPLLGAGIPAVGVQVAGPRGPSAGERVSETRLQNFGRAVLSAVYALDEGPDVKPESGAHLSIGRKTLPGWAMRLLVLALLIPPLVTCVDGLARMRRGRETVGRWILWVLACGAPFLTVALFATLLGTLGIVAAPAGQPPAEALRGDGSAGALLAGTALVGALAWMAWPALVRRLGLPPRPRDTDGAGLASMLVVLTVAGLAWLVNPFASLLLVVGCHVWPTVWAPRTRRPAVSVGAILLSVLPWALVVAVYARELGLGPVGLGESIVVALAGGRVGLGWTLLWSGALGCLWAVVVLATAAMRPDAEDSGLPMDAAITTRGPLSYAGPGSLGGTESALRR